jgi:hypothetical protein
MGKRLEEMREERKADRAKYLKVLLVYVQETPAEELHGAVAELLADFFVSDSIDQITEAVETLVMWLDLPTYESDFVEQFKSKLEG